MDGKNLLQVFSQTTIRAYVITDYINNNDLPTPTNTPHTTATVQVDDYYTTVYR